MSDAPNSFVEGPLGRIFARTAIPIIVVMSMNGLLGLVDAMFLGRFVGPRALEAVTLIFPAFMALAAAGALIGSGMASILARLLGAGQQVPANAVFAATHGLALAVGGVLAGLYAGFGHQLITGMAGAGHVADMAQSYVFILVMASPAGLILAVQSDALRSEGHVGFMAAGALLVSVANIGLDYVLIAGLGLGVAGSALGTVLAQGLALGVIVIYRHRRSTVLQARAIIRPRFDRVWGRIIALGAPQSLGLLGMVLTSGAIIAALRLWGADTLPATLPAYGIMLRIMTFVVMPLLGLSQAMQSIVGNSFGAGRSGRARAGLRLGMAIAFTYAALAEVCLAFGAGSLGRAFVDDPSIARALARILPVSTAMLFVAGPLMMVPAWFQAVGDAPRAAILALAKPYFLVLPLIFTLPAALGEPGIWLAAPIAESLLLGLTLLVLARRRQVLA